jgi:large subunit ribosomal protein L21
MYAIIQNGGKQYKVLEGERVRLERFEAAENEDVRIEGVLAINTGDKTVVGTPFVLGAYVQGKVFAHGRSKKVIVFKFKRRKDYKKKNGHRQPYTELLIEKINMEGEDGT